MDELNITSEAHLRGNESPDTPAHQHDGSTGKLRAQLQHNHARALKKQEGTKYSLQKICNNSRSVQAVRFAVVTTDLNNLGLHGGHHVM